MPVTHYGPLCARPGCRRPDWEDGLCHACRRLARMFGRDPHLFAYVPLHFEPDALPWDEWQAELLGREQPPQPGAG